MDVSQLGYKVMCCADRVSKSINKDSGHQGAFSPNIRSWLEYKFYSNFKSDVLNARDLFRFKRAGIY